MEGDYGSSMQWNCWEYSFVRVKGCGGLVEFIYISPPACSLPPRELQATNVLCGMHRAPFLVFLVVFAPYDDRSFGAPQLAHYNLAFVH